MNNIEGPYSFKGVDGLKTPAYIFKPGGERKDVGEVTVRVGESGMIFAVQLEEEYKDIDTASFDVPMRYTYLNLPDMPKINWGYNCLTTGVHHGRPETLWNIPLLHALRIFSGEVFFDLVVARIYNDAMQYVEHSPFTQKETDQSVQFTQEWADRVRDLSAKKFTNTLKTKVGEISKYYDSPSWERESQEAVRWIHENKLNSNYKPLHGHDSINMFCRIIGVSSSREASPE
jgi:hypothetical protein